jgi:hypothetical protein
MNQDLQNKLYNKYPKIFAQKDLSARETAMCWGISCGDGWFNILDVLCQRLQSLVDKPHEDISMYEEWIKKELEVPDDKRREGWIKKCESFIENSKSEIIDQLEFVQVKQKFGVLRIYLNGYPENEVVRSRVYSFLNFAEDISGKTCEICGNPGGETDSSWVKIRCKSCESL